MSMIRSIPTPAIVPSFLHPHAPPSHGPQSLTRLPPASAPRPLGLGEGQAAFRHTHHKGLLPWHGRFKAQVAEPHLLRGAPGIIPGGRAGINKQRIVPATAALNALAVLLETAAGAPLLALSLGVLLGVGAAGSARHTRLALRLRRRLRAERAELRDLLQALARNPHVSRAARRGREASGRALQRLDSENLLRAYVSLFTGGVGSAAMAPISAMTLLLSRPLFGSLSVTAVGISAILGQVATVGLGVISLGVAAADLYFVRQIGKWRRKVRAARLEPVLGIEEDIRRVVLERLHTRRVQTGLSAAAYLGIAAGAQVTTFAGPFGLGILLPSVAAAFVLGYTRSRRTAYYHRFDRLETFFLGNIHELISSVWREYTLYESIKVFKGEKKLVYPRSETSIFRRPAAAVAAWRRWRRPERVAALEAAEHTLYRFCCLLLRVERVHEGHKRRIAAEEASRTTDPARLRELAQLDGRAAARLQRFAGERAALHDARQRREGFSLFMAQRVEDLLVDAEVTNDFAQRLIDDDRLRKVLVGRGISHRGKLWCVDMPRILAAFQDPAAFQAKARAFAIARFLAHAEATVFENLKHYHRDRCRELCDMLTMRLQEKWFSAPAPGRAHGDRAPPPGPGRC
jgi:hypothetical protein